MQNHEPRIVLIDVTGIIQTYEMHPLAALVLPEVPIQVLISIALCNPVHADPQLLMSMMEKILQSSHPVFDHLNDLEALFESILMEIDRQVDLYATSLGMVIDLPLVLYKWTNPFTVALCYYELRNHHQAMFERSTRGMQHYDPAAGMEQFPYQPYRGA